MKNVLRSLALLLALCPAVRTLAAPLYAEVFSHRGETLIRAGKLEGLRVGASVEIVGGTIAGTSDRRTLGGGIIVEAWDHLAKISLDDEVERHRGKRWAKLGSAPAPVAAAAEWALPPMPEEPAANPGAPLKGAAELDHKFIFRKQVIVHNYGKTRWTGCELRLPNNTVYGPIRVEAGGEYTVMLSDFAQDGEPREVPNDHLLVRCAEGTGDFGLRS